MITKRQFERLRLELDGLAMTTWHKVEVGPARGLAFGEESITDHNVFELDRVCSSIEVYKFDHLEESLNGADFEWYVGARRSGWIGMRFQAKKLDDGAYLELGHRVGHQRQYDLLLERAEADGLWPFYCFYNGWQGDWPGVRNVVCPKDVAPTRVGAAQGSSHVELEHFGCALAPAGYVAYRHSSPRRQGRLALDDYLAHSRPWSQIFRVPQAASGGRFNSESVLAALASTLREWFTTESDEDDANTNRPHFGRPEGDGRFEELPSWLTAVRQGRHGGDRGGYRPRLALVLDLEAT